MLVSRGVCVGCFCLGGKELNFELILLTEALVKPLSLVGGVGSQHSLWSHPFLVGGWTNPSEKYCSSNWCQKTPTFGVNIQDFWNRHLVNFQLVVSDFLISDFFLFGAWTKIKDIPQTVVVSWWFSMRRIWKQSPSIQIQDFYLVVKFLSGSLLSNFYQVTFNTKTPNIWRL